MIKNLKNSNKYNMQYKITKKYINNFGKFIGLKLNLYLRWDESVSVFLLRLNDNKNIFEIPKCNKLEYFQRVLMAFCRFKFHDNFNGYSHYYKSIYPYVLKNLNNE